MKIRPITVLAGVVAVAALSAALVSRQGPTSGEDPSALRPPALPLAIDGAAVTTTAVQSEIARLDHVTYVRGPGVPDLGGSEVAWALPQELPDRAAVDRLAAAFGVTGPAVADEYGLVVGQANGPVLRVGAGGAWAVGDAAAGSAVVACAAPLSIPPTTVPGASTPDTPMPPPDSCRVPAPPPGVPDAPMAEAAARHLLTDAGIDVSTVELAVSAGEWSTEVRGRTVLDGMPVDGLDVSVVFGAHGVVTSANGWLGRPRPLDRYPRIGLDAAIARLQAGLGQVGIIPMTNPGPVPEIEFGDAPVTTVFTTTGSDSSPGSPGSGSSPAVPQPTVTGVSPPPELPQAREVTIVITGASSTLVVVSGTDGTTRLVPAYHLTSSEGGTWTVLAIDPSYVSPGG